MEKVIKLSIYTPYGKYLVTECDYLSLTTGMGVIGVLPNHAPLISNVEICKITIKKDSVNSLYATSGGIINIKKDHSVTLLLNSIERSDEIDVNRAQAAKKRAETLLSETNNKEIKRTRN